MGHKNNCTVCSMSIVLQHLLEKEMPIKDIYDVVASRARKFGFTGKRRGTNPFTISWIMKMSAKKLGVKARARSRYLKGVGFNYDKIKKLIDDEIPVIISFYKTPRYKNHSITIVGYNDEARELICYDNWSLKETAIMYYDFSFISSINYMKRMEK